MMHKSTQKCSLATMLPKTQDTVVKTHTVSVQHFRVNSRIQYGSITVWYLWKHGVTHSAI